MGEEVASCWLRGNKPHQFGAKDTDTHDVVVTYGHLLRTAYKNAKFCIHVPRRSHACELYVPTNMHPYEVLIRNPRDEALCQCAFHPIHSFAGRLLARFLSQRKCDTRLLRPRGTSRALCTFIDLNKVLSYLLQEMNQKAPNQSAAQYAESSRCREKATATPCKGPADDGLFLKFRSLGTANHCPIWLAANPWRCLDP